MLELSETQLDWRNTPIPNPQQIRDFFMARGVDVGRVSPQASGTVIVFAATDPRDVWKTFGQDDAKEPEISPAEVWYAKLKAGTATDKDVHAALAFILEQHINRR
jgi:hypothetical protein